jgi:hypothetical protein
MAISASLLHRTEIERICTVEEGYEVLLAAILRQAFADAAGTTQKTTLQSRSDIQAAAQAGPWLDDCLPRWRKWTNNGSVSN